MNFFTSKPSNQDTRFGSQHQHPNEQNNENNNGNNVESKNGYPCKLVSSGPCTSSNNGALFTNFTLQTATPTTAISQDLYAMGTTGITSENALFQMKSMNDGISPANNSNNNNNNDPPTIITTLQGEANAGNANTNTGGNSSQNCADDNFSSSSTTKCLLSSTSSLSISQREAAAAYGPDTDVPRGKLQVTIIEARDLVTRSKNSQPYVVCTFESSEFISNGPESLGSGHNDNQNQHNQNQHSNNNNNENINPDAASQHHNNNNNNSGWNGPQLPSIKEHLKRKPLYTHRSSSQLDQLNSSTATESNKRSSNSSSGSSNGPNNNSSHPIWHHKTTFDVLGSHSELDISVYDAAHDHMFLGQVRLCPMIHNLAHASQHQWHDLKPRVIDEVVSGDILIKWTYKQTKKRHYGPQDFEVLRLLGRGTFGQVYQVKKKDTQRIYAMKVLSKKVIVKKNEIAHTIGERNILVTTASKSSPFIVGLKFSFQTPTDLYLVTDYMSGGELFWHLQKEGRFSEDRAKFYIAELVLALEHLHDNDIVYRDLKPENILLDANGNIALCDFGLSKADLKDRTNTFCGTTEYLAPELLLDETGYTKMVDFWSLGVLIFEMCCGWSPFFAENNQKMYQKIAFGKVKFPRDVLSQEGRSFVKGLLNRNPKHRLGAIDDGRELRAHPFFADIDWEALKQKKIPPPFKPHLISETDTSNFDPEFTTASTSYMNKHQPMMTATPLSPAMQAKFAGFTFVDESAIDEHVNNNRKFLQNSYFMEPGSFIPGNPNLPPDEDVIDDDGDEDINDGFSQEKSMNNSHSHIDFDGDQHMDDEFVSGRFEI
ncbi:Sch9p [Saccharomyces cerevisiae x Saccharomyces kudriavzevii VIN7]|uniref:Serine/threonine-protein kinase SCH9 n=1 Tax=Saccharomyces cerevisiae x Saccharomyces kudriavzevii (strain VIN7) TaxID=1095631 RepID=H0GW26_SACCK|nr:Sch9p [Saccharomyces cerevisiae x Saccharomyces kudriavzevii VIN7]